MLFLLWFANRRNKAFAWARLAPHTRERARVDLPTSARRTAWVCRVAVRPRVPPCAGERSGRPIWIPAHWASCRGDRTLLSPTFQRLLRLCSALTGRRREKEKALKMTSLLTRACRLEDHFARSPFPKLSAAAWLLSWNFSPVTRRSGWKLFLRCAPKVWSVLTPREGGGTICAAPPTPLQHTHAHAL